MNGGLLARVIVTVALLVLAALIIWQSPGQNGVTYAAPLITLIAGYWLAHTTNGSGGDSSK